MKLVRLKPVLRPLFPYEFEIPAGPSGTPWFRWALSNRVPSSCPVRRIPRQDPLHTTGWESLTNGWYTIIPKDKVKAESLLITEHSSHTSMCINNVSSFCCLPIHQLVAKFSSYFIEIEWWHSFYYISATLHLTIFGIWSKHTVCAIRDLCYDSAGVMKYWVGNTIHNMNCCAFMYITGHLSAY